MKSGVYTITNKANGKMYVGSSIRYCSTRFGAHRRALRNGTHFNQHLQRAWNKYGESSFRFEILEEYPPELCLSMEYYWVMMLDTVTNGYNASYPGLGTIGYKFSKTTRKKMSDKAKLRDRSHLYTKESRDKISKAISARNSAIPVRKGTGKYGKCEKYDLNWNLLHTYNDLYEAFKDIGLRHGSHIIRASLNGSVRGGFRWKVYTKDGNLIE